MSRYSYSRTRYFLRNCTVAAHERVVQAFDNLLVAVATIVGLGRIALGLGIITVVVQGLAIQLVGFGLREAIEALLGRFLAFVLVHHLVAVALLHHLVNPIKVGGVFLEAFYGVEVLLLQERVMKR